MNAARLPPSNDFESKHFYEGRRDWFQWKKLNMDLIVKFGGGKRREFKESFFPIFNETSDGWMEFVWEKFVLSRCMTPSRQRLLIIFVKLCFVNGYP